MTNNPRGSLSRAGQPLILRARVILPISAPPIENGAILIYRDRIASVSPWEKLPRELKSASPEIIQDLGEVILLPGLVNAHCHLDYTDMAGLWPPPKKFLDWIPRMLAAKAEWSYSDYARSWLNGARMLLQSGTTTVADIEAAPELLPDVWSSTPLRVFSFLELTGVRSQRNPAEILEEAMTKIETLEHPRCGAALSPHAPYSTPPELIRLCAQTAQTRNLQIAIHVSESDQEYEMFTHARGEMFDWLKKNGRDNSDCGLGTPLQHLKRSGLTHKNYLAVHANYLDDDDLDMLAEQNFSVIHCPRSHDYFQHKRFPLDRLLDANVNICLGTDSLATVTKSEKTPLALSMFHEMQLFARSNPEVAPETILKMATVNGARALRMTRNVGELSSTALADIIAIPFTGNAADATETAVNFHGPVRASMIGGDWAIPPA